MNLALIDFDRLEKGSVIPVEVVEDVLGCKQHLAIFSMRFMSLRQAVENHFATKGQVVTVRHDHGALEVMPDDAASHKNHAEFGRHMRGLNRSHHLMSGVSVKDFDDRQIREHDRKLEVQGKILQAIGRVREKVEPMKLERITPAA